MTNPVASAAVVALASRLVEHVGALDAGWTKVFFRFRSDGSRYGSNASYVTQGGVLLIGAVKNGTFYDEMNEKDAALFQELGKDKGVFLLSVDAPSNYDMKFEWNDLSRWEISKGQGASGLPKGL